MRFIQKFKWLWLQLFFTICLIAGRIVHTSHLTFVFITWNLLLAFLPLLFSYLTLNSKSKPRSIFFAVLWLIFFPNSIYIVTDLIHLEDRGDIPFWYDLLLLFSAALNGLVLGFVSLHQVEQWLRTHINRGYIRLIIFILLFGCGFGVYLGRFHRWNSWDVVAQPLLLLEDIASQVLHPFHNIQGWLLSLFFAWWMFVAYQYFRTARFKE